MNSMPTLKLDEFVQMVQSAVAEVQAGITERSRGRLERLVELDREGHTDALTWSFVLEGDPQSARPALRLPLMTLWRHSTPQLAHFSLEMRAAIEEESAPKAGRRFRLVIPRPGRWKRRRLHRLAIELEGPQPGRGRISVDGVPLKCLPADPDDRGSGGTEKQ